MSTCRAPMALSYVCMTSSQEQRRAEGRLNVRTSEPGCSTQQSACSTPQGPRRRHRGPSQTQRAKIRVDHLLFRFPKRDLVDEAMVTAARRLIQPVVAEFADDGRDGITKLLSAVQRSTASSTNMRVSSALTSTHSLRPQPTTQSPPKCDHCTAQTLIGSHCRNLRSTTARTFARLGASRLDDATHRFTRQRRCREHRDRPRRNPATAVGSQFTQLLLAARTPAP